jgi:hypothetical protein
MHALLIIGVFLLMASNPAQAQASAAPTPAEGGALREDGQYRNQVTLPRDGVLKKLRIGLKYLFLSKPADTRPAAPLPVRRVTPGDLASAPDNSLWRLGHSTVLLKVRGHFFAGAVGGAKALSCAAHRPRRAAADQGGAAVP